MDSFNHHLSAVTINDQLFHFIFTVQNGTRLRNGAQEEFISIVECKVLDDRLQIVAIGRAICSEDDEFFNDTGAWLALARALDDAEDSGEWNGNESSKVLSLFQTAADLDDSLDALPTRVWNEWLKAETRLAETKILIAALNEARNAPHVPADIPDFQRTPRLVKPEVKVWQTVNDPEMEHVFWVWDGYRPYRMTAAENWKLVTSYFDPDWMDSSAGFTRVTDPRPKVERRDYSEVPNYHLVLDAASIELPPGCLWMNDQFRQDAKRLGVELDNSTGTLTMRDLSALYHAALNNRSLGLDRFDQKAEGLAAAARLVA